MVQAVGSLVHGLCYATLALVLVREGDRFAGYGRVVRATRQVLTASLGVLCVGFIAVAILSSTPPMCRRHASRMAYEIGEVGYR